MAYREQWGRDVVIDLIGYRRYGHNETDEPAYTQPTMAAKIKEHPPVSELYARKLMDRGVVTAEDVESEAERSQEQLQTTLKRLRTKMEAGEYEDPSSTALGTGELDRSRPGGRDGLGAAPTLTQRGAARCLTASRSIASCASRWPGTTSSSRARDRVRPRRESGVRLAAGSREPTSASPARTPSAARSRTVTWPCTTRRPACATFRFRTRSGALALFELHNSPLSEAGCLGFEYGYSAASPESLMLWEAQFGDFANSAQVIIDSFIVAGESKWGQTVTRLTLLLPHGYEGAGPGTSSARIERFIQLGSEGNIRLANPTTAAQYFHLLRRQARIAKPRPLVVFTPKGLLRLRAASSSLEELTSGTFRFVLDDPRFGEDRDKIDRLCLQRQALLRHRPARAPRVRDLGRAWPRRASIRSRATSSSA